eukprot:4182663-Pyramimonas_sp.AAC.1
MPTAEDGGRSGQLAIRSNFKLSTNMVVWGCVGCCAASGFAWRVYLDLRISSTKIERWRRKYGTGICTNPGPQGCSTRTRSQLKRTALAICSLSNRGQNDVLSRRVNFFLLC